MSLADWIRGDIPQWDEIEIRELLEQIGETDPQTIAEVLDNCRKNENSLQACLSRNPT